MPIPAWIWYLVLGVALGAIALYMWTNFTRQTFTRQTHIQDRKPEPRDRFDRVRASMPHLISEMARDVMMSPTVRSCVPLGSRSIVSNVSGEHFIYYASEHPDLFAKFDILVNNRYLKDITPGSRWDSGKQPVYAMTEEFVERLRKTI
jgi:hypothetical protein